MNRTVALVLLGSFFVNQSTGHLILQLQIISILDMIRNSISQAPEAAALFYDELARIIQLGGIDPKIEVHW